MSDDRRDFINRLGKLGAGITLAGIATVASAEGAGQGKSRHAGKRGHAFVMASDTTNKCATCVFWGGQRHITRDKAAVHVTSLGMCNNPASANYHRTTSPDTGPMPAWVKWPALDA